MNVSMTFAQNFAQNFALSWHMKQRKEEKLGKAKNKSFFLDIFFLFNISIIFHFAYVYPQIKSMFFMSLVLNLLFCLFFELIQYNFEKHIKFVSATDAH